MLASQRHSLLYRPMPYTLRPYCWGTHPHLAFPAVIHVFGVLGILFDIQDEALYNEPNRPCSAIQDSPLQFPLLSLLHDHRLYRDCKLLWWNRNLSVKLWLLCYAYDQSGNGPCGSYGLLLLPKEIPTWETLQIERSRRKWSSNIKNYKTIFWLTSN